MISCDLPSPVRSSPPAKPPAAAVLIAVPLALSASEKVAKALTLPLISIVQSPAGMIMPALAVADNASTEPATVL